MPRCAGRGIFNLAFSGEPTPSLRTCPLLSDYAWNHTTLWAMKADEKYTYIVWILHELERKSERRGV